MRIAELFASLQGEGVLTGVPSLFIRVSGCNLRCRWCDTPYTSWRPEGDERSKSEILAWVRGFPHYRHIVVTGGEPMLFDEIVPLCAELRRMGMHITIETAGTVFREVACDLMSVSPKLANSTPDDAVWGERHERTRIQPEVLRRLIAGSEYQLKFVVASAADLDEVQSVQALCGAPNERVLLMPEGIDAEVLRERSLWLAELCKLHGYRFTPRLHVMLWGARRGV